MKFTVFALIACLSLVVVNANGGAFESPEVIEFQPLEFAEEIVDVDNHGIFFGIYFVLKGALRTLKGLNCSIKEVMNIKLAAQKFINDIQDCGGQVSKQVQDIINSCTAIISTCNDIINLNTNLCPADETTGKTPWNCFWKLLKSFLTLKKQIKNTISLIKKVPTIGTGASACVVTATNNLSSAFTQFPANVKSCSKLTS